MINKKYIAPPIGEIRGDHSKEIDGAKLCIDFKFYALLFSHI